METYLGSSKEAIQSAVNACQSFDITTTGPILNGLQQAYQTGDSYLFMSQLFLLHQLGNNDFIHCIANFLTSMNI